MSHHLLRSAIFDLRFAFFSVFLLSAPAIAQPQIVDFKQLQQFLPQGRFGDYLPDKPTGETSTMMGFFTSWAQVDYRSPTDSTILSAKITDLLNIPNYMFDRSVYKWRQRSFNPGRIRENCDV